MFPEHILSVRATVDPGRETEFNRWYDSEHVPEPYAFESAARLAAALSGPEIQELIKIHNRGRRYSLIT
jgi:hypothetical protein